MGSEMCIRDRNVARHLPADVVEQAAILGALNAARLADHTWASEAASHIANRLDGLAKPLERGWEGISLDDGGIAFTLTLRGVTERHAIDGALVRSQDAKRLDEDTLVMKLQKLYEKPGILSLKGKEVPITGPVSLVDGIMEFGRKGINMQRYKGLGEMNPNQLWETTLDPNVRTLLQVKVSHTDDAEEDSCT